MASHKRNRLKTKPGNKMRGGRYTVNIAKVVEFLNWTYQCVKEKYCQYFGVAFFSVWGKIQTSAKRVIFYL